MRLQLLREEALFLKMWISNVIQVGGWVGSGPDHITTACSAKKNKRKTNEKNKQQAKNKRKTKTLETYTKTNKTGWRGKARDNSKMQQNASNIQQNTATERNILQTNSKIQRTTDKYNKHSRCNCFPGCSGRSVGGDWTTPNGRPIGGGISVKSADFPENQ